MPAQKAPRSLNVLVALTDPSTFKFGCAVVARLNRLQHVSLRVVACNEFPASAHYNVPSYLEPVWHQYDIKSNNTPAWQHEDFIEEKVAEYCSWADLLVLAPLDAENLAQMLHGLTTNLHLQILRSWDVSKKVILIPAMSTLMWENPMSKKQMSKIRRKWNWIRVLPPFLWSFDQSGRKYQPWGGHKEFNESIQTQIDLMAVGDRTIALPIAHMPTLTPTKTKGLRLPPELWSIILEFTEDWELATTLNVHTNLPVPPEWRQASSEEGPKTQMQKLEWALLTYPYAEAQRTFDSESPTRISRLCIELIMRFALVPMLTHLEHYHKDLFWGTFGHAFLPHKASVFGKPEILEYWRTSPTFLTKEYSPEAIDNASRTNSVATLDWWFDSGLPLKYTEAALEQASSQGHLAVLKWWQEHSRYRTTTTPPPPSPGTKKPDPTTPKRDLKLKVGKSITYATQSGNLPAITFWTTSQIPFSHEDTVAKIASTHGHTPILDYWKQLRQEKMLFDNQVLVGPTKMGHANVLEWWKKSGLRVEYKTCDIEEALEDGVEGERGEGVRRWWALNGLNLGVGTSEWMRVKVLGSW
jgi:hypothetical protein